MTAKELLDKEFEETEGLYNMHVIEQLLTTFASHHVQEALKSAYQNAMIVIREVPELDKDSILKCYPLENIK